MQRENAGIAVLTAVRFLPQGREKNAMQDADLRYV